VIFGENNFIGVLLKPSQSKSSLGIRKRL